MCNIAGYVGSKNATPILLKMIQAQEGLYGGFYSGLAIHNGEGLDYRKMRGDFAKLLANTDSASLTGNMGIIHSRTPSGGGDEWAHPFYTEQNGKVEMCYVANGSLGKYSASKTAYNAIADRLVGEGIDIPCKIKDGCTDYNQLASGEYVHMSDVMCQLIYRYKRKGLHTAEAMTAAFTEMPSEIVGLTVCREDPDKIFFSRINCPMFVGFDEDGAYLASSPTAFPESVTAYKLLPALSSGVVYRDRFEITERYTLPVKVRGYNRKTVANAMTSVLVQLQSGECGAGELMRPIRAQCPADECVQVAAIVYMALDQLLKRGAIKRRESTQTVDGQVAPKALFRLATE